MVNWNLIIGIQIAALILVIGCVFIMIYVLSMVSTIKKETEEIKRKLLKDN